MENLLDRKACSPRIFPLIDIVFSPLLKPNKIVSLRDLKGLDVSVSVIPKFGMSHSRSHVTLSCRGPTMVSTKKK